LQDAHVVKKLCNDCMFAVVSDGAGSARYGVYGAWITCRALTVSFRDWMRANSELPSNEVVEDWIDKLRDRISASACLRESTPRQFAATLAMILVTPDDLLTLQIGDSAVVGRKGSDWNVLCWPENGEYASSTYFITDDPAPRLKICRQPRVHDAFALFTDGVGDLALSHQEGTAHPQFFGPMFRPIDAAEGDGRLSELSEKLYAYLESPTVCDRTDDDKTLILISGE